MLTEEQIETLANKVNKEVNISIIGERLEFILIRFGIRRLDAKLQEVLPPDLYKMLEDASDGLSDEEIKVIEDKVVTILNEKVNVPILDEEQEKKLITAMMDKIIKALQKGKTLKN